MIEDVFLVQPIHTAGVERLGAAGIAVRHATRSDMATVAAEIAHADAVVTRNAGLDRAAIDAAPRLKLIVIHGVGHDPVDVAHAVSKGIPVILDPMFDFPPRRDQPYDRLFSLPRDLSEAGIRIAFSMDKKAPDARNLPYAAAMAVAYGLPEDRAIEAITPGRR